MDDSLPVKDRTPVEKWYKAIVWPNGPDKPEQRVTVAARSLAEARELIQEEYGEGEVFNLHLEESAQEIR